MSSPLFIGILSIIPGLGLLLQGKLKAAVLVWSLLALSGLVALLSPSAHLRTLAGFAAIAVWLGQILYSSLLALRQKRTAGPVQSEQSMNRPSRSATRNGLSPSQISTMSIVAPLLRPDELLLVSTLGMDGPPGRVGRQQYAIGVTETDLIALELTAWRAPGELTRIPIEKIVDARYVQAPLADHIELHIAGREAPLSFYFYPICRPLVSEIVASLRAGGGPPGHEGGAEP